MAEGTSICQDDVACRFFLLGACKDGKKCLFSHDRTRHVPDSVCRYYLQGSCIFGQRCRYDHFFLNKKSTSRTNSFCESISASRPRFSANHNAAADSIMSDAKKNWANAPEFVPRHMRPSYADIVRADVNNGVISKTLEWNSSDKLCPLFAEGECPFVHCQLIHGNVCELCQKAYLHPFNEEARKSHIEKCEKELEQEMEYSFAIHNSLKKTCGICLDIVLEKELVSERRFGLLENCNHVYCLSCIRKWRQTKQTECNELNTAFDVIRACPECRIVSDFITPSTYFVESEEEKQKLITEYKDALSKKHCKYFKKGDGVCPFGGSCFYLHAKPDGTKVDLPLPSRRRRQNQDGDLDFLEAIHLWDFLDYREDNSLFNEDLLTLLDNNDDDNNDDFYDVGGNIF